MRPDTLKSIEVLAAKNPHGTRVKYMGGCRCDLCRRTATRYESTRRNEVRNGRGNPIVNAAKAKNRILALRSRNIGRRLVSELSGIRQQTIQVIGAGKKIRIRRKTHTQIMAVPLDTVPQPHALIDATETWRLIRILLSEGFTKAELARRLGRKGPALQINRETITVKTAHTVRVFFNRIMIGG